MDIWEKAVMLVDGLHRGGNGRLADQLLRVLYDVVGDLAPKIVGHCFYGVARQRVPHGKRRKIDEDDQTKDDGGVPAISSV